MRVAEGSPPRAALSRLGRTMLVSLALSASAVSIAACGSGNGGSATPSQSAQAGAPAQAAAKPSGGITGWGGSGRPPGPQAHPPAPPGVPRKNGTYEGGAHRAP